jgi:hypothetical protein
MNGRYLNPILHSLRDIENSQRCGYDGVQGSFCEIHSRTNASSITKADFSRIALCWPLCCGDMPFRIEDEWIGVDLWIMKHVPIDEMLVNLTAKQLRALP